ncbi:phage P2 GpE-like tail protein [Novosphingobium sp. Rr 2-17]|uniref:phage tail assembly protein n=1 Tax=Novosphingobium sp. Rr 2-17 TaxID=555793 RepID=UPI00026985A8|nr:phage tail assembly protein [Novosphingobium sp. Rr 2-17]EIZ77780.1 phage P2 GpE-like tail protein [Novosphingobium sp. Rr 2-17]
MSEANTPALRTVTLDYPITRGEQTITVVQVRKPASGELRDLSMSALLNLDYNALEKLLPRITMPLLSKNDISTLLDPADLTQMATEVMDFLLPKGAKAALSPNA